jgi:transposase
MTTPPDPQTMLAAAKAMPPSPSRSRLAPYADAIRELQARGYSTVKITQFLAKHGLKIRQSSVWRWLKRHPFKPTVTEAVSKSITN